MIKLVLIQCFPTPVGDRSLVQAIAFLFAEQVRYFTLISSSRFRLETDINTVHMRDVFIVEMQVLMSLHFLASNHAYIYLILLIFQPYFLGFQKFIK